MKTTKILVTVFFFLLIANFGFAQTQVLNLKVNANSDHCKKIIEKSLLETRGVGTASFDINTQIATINYDKSMTNETSISKVLTDKGYIVEVVKTKCCNGQTNANCCNGKSIGKDENSRGKSNGNGNNCHDKTDGNDGNSRGKTNGNGDNCHDKTDGNTDNSKGKTNGNTDNCKKKCQ